MPQAQASESPLLDRFGSASNDATFHETPHPDPAKISSFGSYGAAVNDSSYLSKALDKVPESKINGSMDFADPSKRWIKDVALTTSTMHDHRRAWETEIERVHRDHRKWSDTYRGRLAIRAVSRGVVGSAFFAAANIYAGKALSDYNLHTDAKGFLPTIARIIDNTFGKAIQWSVKTVTGSEEKALEAVMFRDTRYMGYQKPLAEKVVRKGVETFEHKKLFGRSLGAEAVSVTFDFAAMSFSDYMTRYVIGLLDPNAQKDWMKDGHISIPGAVKDVMKNVFRGITYAAGEDMAVAIPYVYGMRLQRNIIGKFSPGFPYDSDRVLNGGSKVIKNGQVVGDHQMEGALDLMGRFSWYNVGTKMYRDFYAKVETKFDEWKQGGYQLKMPHIKAESFAPSHIAKSIGHGINYVVRTTIKVMSYMLPSTALFFLARTPQSSVRGIAIDPEKGVLGRTVGNEHEVFSGIEETIYKPIKPGSLAAHAGEIGLKKTDPNHNLWYRRVNKSRETFKRTEDMPFTNNRTDAFNGSYYRMNGNKAPWYDAASNKIGRFCYDAGTFVTEGLTKAAEKLNINVKPQVIEGFSRRWVNAATTYPIYFMGKTDVLSAAWDTDRTDMGIDRMLSGITHFKGSEIKKGWNEYVRSLVREPFADPIREALAQKDRWTADPEHQSNEAFQLNAVDLERNARERKKMFATNDLKAKKIIPSTFTQLKPQNTSWTTQEALRQFQDAETQGQSIH